ncbi:LysR family transcriptional regulator [Pseudomonas luteola]|uniref:LysR family transcriptional regulator n=1 Tax=Pseudomonas luteola TaxID=47886 RepID=UPI000F79A51C|nr:LysR family transcriptional regulator [Pseudomonas luteola]RRW47918.1 LysR family transcriptional regulator [Pseudomonas luteola]
MELRHLRYFVAVADELHFGRAAELLGISQPPLSQQIQALEEELGARLFERTNRRVALTEAGRLFLDEARQVLAQVDKATDIARRAQRGELGELQVGFTVSAPFIATVPRSIFNFRQRFPAVHLALQEMSSREQTEALMDRKLQVGLIRPITMSDALVSIELFREPLVAVMRADHPLALQTHESIAIKQLAEEPFVYFPRTYGTGLYDQLISLSQQAGFSPRIVQEARETTIIIGLVAAGLGVSVLPATYRRMHIEGVVYRTLVDEGATSALWLIHRRDERSPLARAFIELLTQGAGIMKSS